MGISIIAVIIVLSVLIFVHELGHFLVARWFGVGVETFSLGFGPRIFGKKSGITDYRVSAIPLGGYVKMIGEDPEADIEPTDIHLSFTHKHVFKRILIVAAGPVFNFLLAFVIFCGFFQIYGTYYMEPVIGSVKEGTPAHTGGLQKGDRVIAINGYAIKTWTDMSEVINSGNGGELAIKVLRREAVVDFKITPALMTEKDIFDEDVKRYMIGITASGNAKVQKLNPLQAFSESIVQTYKISELTVVGFVKLIQGRISSKNLGGPIMIAQMAGDQAREGISNLIFFIALISINLAIINFLPIPVLDGGHLLFFVIEAVRGRPVSIRVREIAQQGGLIILVLLMIFAFYNDFMRVFSE